MAIRLSIRLGAILSIFGMLLSAANGVESSLTPARRLYLTGKYAEAQKEYEGLAASEPVASAIGVARSWESRGDLAKATETLQAAVEKNPKTAELHAELARLALENGTTQQAAKEADAALALDRDQPLAHWVRAEVFRLEGRLDEAKKAYRWFVRYYNDHDIKDPDALRYVALGAAQHARWNRLSDQFQSIINDVLPEAAKLDENYWPAHYEAGCLFLEKYNEGEAAREFAAGLAINPSAAELRLGQGMLALESFNLADAQQAVDKVLEINPALVDAQLLQADIHLANSEPSKAIETLEKALARRPTSPAVRGRLAAAYIALEGEPRPGQENRAAKMIDRVVEENPHAGEFFLTLADALNRQRRFEAAARYYQEAVDRMPQLTGARGELGMALMRLGDEERSQKILAESFEIDPFNIRVGNTLKVLELLKKYETLETEHFLIKFDPRHDKLAAKYAARWLEEVYPELCDRFGFRPPQKSLFEIFSPAKGTDGHGWFSIRMAGVPRIHTIGACAGKMVAMQSPNDGRHFNWSRVLKHEFVHVINLQQTHFNIPHWFTEGLAVLSEGYPRPTSWNELLVERSRKGRLFDLDSIQMGFIRPQSSDEWTLAYCQAELYTQFMLEKYGPDALAKMLAAYGDNLTTREAIKRSFGVEQPEFERGYREYLAKAVQAIPRPPEVKTLSFAQLEKAAADDPKNADRLAELAQGQLKRRKKDEAKRSAEAALAARPKHPLATYVVAQLQIADGQEQEAIEQMAAALDADAPQLDLLGSLANLLAKHGEFDEAARLLGIGLAREPTNPTWRKSLAAVYVKSNENKKLAQVLTRLAEEDSEDLPMRKKLTALAVERKDWPEAIRWGNEAIRIDVMDEDLHRLLAEAYSGQGNAASAAEEYEAALEIQPGALKVRFALAQALVQAGQRDKARETLGDILRRDADHREAAELLKSLDSP